MLLQNLKSVSQALLTERSNIFLQSFIGKLNVFKVEKDNEYAIAYTLIHLSITKRSSDMNVSTGKIKKTTQPKDRTKDENLERMKGIGPSPRAWEARVLPLNYTR